MIAQNPFRGIVKNWRNPLWWMVILSTPIMIRQTHKPILFKFRRIITDWDGYRAMTRVDKTIYAKETPSTYRRLI